MKNILLCLIILLITGATAVANVNYYKDKENRYTFIIPTNWDTIPVVNIDSAFKEYYTKAGNSFRYNAGLYPENRDHYYQYPYVLIMNKLNKDLSHISIDKIISKLSSELTGQNLENTARKYSNDLSKISVNVPIVDTIRNAVYYNVEYNIKNAGTCIGLLGAFVGNDGITYFNCYSEKSSYENNLPVYLSLLNSFEYNEASKYKYVDGRIIQNKWIDIGLKSLLAIVIGFIVVLYIRFKKKESGGILKNT